MVMTPEAEIERLVRENMGLIRALFAQSSESSEYREKSEQLNAENTVLDQEENRALQEAIQKLPSPNDAVIRMMYFEGKPLGDVARELGLSAQRVQYLHSRALRMLR